jgi:hypothetical protein
VVLKGTKVREMRFCSARTETVGAVVVEESSVGEATRKVLAIIFTSLMLRVEERRACGDVGVAEGSGDVGDVGIESRFGEEGTKVEGEVGKT